MREVWMERAQWERLDWLPEFGLCMKNDRGRRR